MNICLQFRSDSTKLLKDPVASAQCTASWPPARPTPTPWTPGSNPSSRAGRPRAAPGPGAESAGPDRPSRSRSSPTSWKNMEKTTWNRSFVCPSVTHWRWELPVVAKGNNGTMQWIGFSLFYQYRRQQCILLTMFFRNWAVSHWELKAALNILNQKVPKYLQLYVKKVLALSHSPGSWCRARASIGLAAPQRSQLVAETSWERSCAKQFHPDHPPSPQQKLRNDPNRNWRNSQVSTSDCCRNILF